MTDRPDQAGAGPIAAFAPGQANGRANPPSPRPGGARSGSCHPPRLPASIVVAPEPANRPSRPPPSRRTSARVLARLFACTAALLVPTAAVAQAPITLVVNFAAGGPTDITARLLAPELTAALGAQVVVKTVTGASGTIGAAEVARARPDGQTLLFSPVGPLAIQPHFQTRNPYRAASFAPICQVTETPVVLMTPAASGLRTLADVATRARAAGGGMPFASTGPGTLPHISMVAWTRAAGLTMVHVPYRGAGEVMVAFQQGSVEVFADQPAVIRQHGLHAIAVFAPDRTPELPGVPTMRELGHDLSYTIWQGLFAPAAIPASVQDRLETACAAAVRAPSVTEGLARLQMAMVVRDAPALASFLAAESEKFAALIEASGMRRAE